MTEGGSRTDKSSPIAKLQDSVLSATSAFKLHYRFIQPYLSDSARPFFERFEDYPKQVEKALHDYCYEVGCEVPLGGGNG